MLCSEVCSEFISRPKAVLDVSVPHRPGDYVYDLLWGLGKVGIASRRAAPPMHEQFADQGQVLTRHDRGARCRVSFALCALPAPPPWHREWRISSLIETAKMNAVNRHTYLKATLEAIAGGHPASDIDQLLPWAFTPISR